MIINCHKIFRKSAPCFSAPWCLTCRSRDKIPCCAPSVRTHTHTLRAGVSVQLSRTCNYVNDTPLHAPERTVAYVQRWLFHRQQCVPVVAVYSASLRSWSPRCSPLTTSPSVYQQCRITSGCGCSARLEQYAVTTSSRSFRYNNNNNNNNNNHDDIYSAVIFGASHMREFTVVPLGRSRVSDRWPPTRRPNCKLDLWVCLYRLL